LEVELVDAIEDVVRGLKNDVSFGIVEVRGVGRRGGGRGESVVGIGGSSGLALLGGGGGACRLGHGESGREEGRVDEICSRKECV